MFILEYKKAVWVHNHYFLPLNTIKGNSMKVAVDNIILKPSKINALELKKASVYDHPTVSSNVTF